MSSGPIFISYSREDLGITTQLAKFIRVILRHEVVPFTDADIPPGADWQAALERAMAAAKVAILIISIDALDSSFMREEEFPTLLRLREKDGLTVIPVLVRPCPYDRIPWLRGINRVPRDGEPLFNDRRGPYEIEAEMTAIADLVAKSLDPQPAVERGRWGESRQQHARVPATEAAARREQSATRQQSRNTLDVKLSGRSIVERRSVRGGASRPRAAGGKRWTSKA
jgi:hypothetical protein